MDDDDNDVPNSLFDQAKLDLETAKTDLDLHKAELLAFQSRYNEAVSRYKSAMQRFLQADLSRLCRWNQMVSIYIFYVISDMFCLMCHNKTHINNNLYTLIIIYISLLFV